MLTDFEFCRFGNALRCGHGHAKADRLGCAETVHQGDLRNVPDQILV